MKQALIQFSKVQTATCVSLLVKSISVIANCDGLPKDVEEIINDLSIVLAVMRKCHKAAPHIPNLPVTMATAQRHAPARKPAGRKRNE